MLSPKNTMTVRVKIEEKKENCSAIERKLFSLLFTSILMFLKENFNAGKKRK
jgi:hypothetical protein